MAPDQARAVGQLELDPPGSVGAQCVRCEDMQVVVVVAGGVDPPTDERLGPLRAAEPRSNLGLPAIAERELDHEGRLFPSLEGAVPLRQTNRVGSELEHPEIDLVVFVAVGVLGLVAALILEGIGGSAPCGGLRGGIRPGRTRHGRADRGLLVAMAVGIRAAGQDEQGSGEARGLLQGVRRHGDQAWVLESRRSIA